MHNVILFSADLRDSIELRMMKPTAHIINIGRGPIIDQAALIEALKNGVIAGAGLDVFVEEPLPADSELWDMENFVITPHVGGQSPEARVVSLEIFMENFRRYAAGKPLRNVIDKQRQF